MTEISIKIKKLRENVCIPVKQKDGDAGYDCFISIFSAIEYNILRPMKIEMYILKPLNRVACHLGFATEIPKGYYAQIVPRSGLALWKGLSIVNSPATIDSGYRGEWIATVVNLSNENVVLKVGERICQIIIRKLVEYELSESIILSESIRGESGFGITGQ